MFEGRLYVYPSHDIDAGTPENDEGDHFDMRDYHVLSLASLDSEVVDHGVALAVEDVPWASRQLWAPDHGDFAGEHGLMLKNLGIFESINRVPLMLRIPGQPPRVVRRAR